MLVYGTPEQVNSTLDSCAGSASTASACPCSGASWRRPTTRRRSRTSTRPTRRSTRPENWVRYDRLIQAAQTRGIQVNLNITSPVPRWAATESPRADIQETFGPSPEEFGKFVHAVATRYSGTYAGLPRVDFWSIWNEPNQSGWLTPQWGPDPRNAKKFVDAAPALYRNLVANAWQALADTGHGTDTILIGETAPQGAGKERGLSKSIDALKFIRRLYCLDDNLNLLKGAESSVRGCPSDIATFVAQNPGLFHATGYAHHPYALLTPPSARSKNPDWVSMSDLRALSRELTRIYKRFGQKLPTHARRAPVPDRVRLPDQARPDERHVRSAGGLHQRGRVHRVPQPARPRGQPVPARGRCDGRGRRSEEEPAPRLPHVPERAAVTRRQAQAVLSGIRHADLRQCAAAAPRPVDVDLRRAAPGRGRNVGAAPRCSSARAAPRSGPSARR